MQTDVVKKVTKSDNGNVMNGFRVGARYRTDDGTVMKIRSVDSAGVTCDDSASRGPHVFDAAGTSLCAAGCTHGGLSERISGRATDRGE